MSIIQFLNMNGLSYVEEMSHRGFGDSDLPIVARAEHPHSQPNRIVVPECLLPTNHNSSRLNLSLTSLMGFRYNASNILKLPL